MTEVKTVTLPVCDVWRLLEIARQAGVTDRGDIVGPHDMEVLRRVAAALGVKAATEPCPKVTNWTHG